MTQTRQCRWVPALGITIAGVLTTSLAADPIGMDDFSGLETLIDFETILPEEPITTQFSVLGLNFEPGLFGDPFPASTIQGTMEATNFNGSITNPIVALFDEPQLRIGFLAAGDSIGGSLILLRAFLSDIVVDEFTFTTDEILPGGTLPSVFAGLEVLGGFNRIEIRRLGGGGAFSIDDFRFEIPAPGTLALFGLAGLCGTRLRRR